MSRTKGRNSKTPLFKGTIVKSWEAYPRDLGNKPPYIIGRILMNEVAPFFAKKFSGLTTSLQLQFKLSASTLGGGEKSQCHVFSSCNRGSTARGAKKQF